MPVIRKRPPTTVPMRGSASLFAVGSGAPHLAQNRAPSRFGVWQAGHSMRAWHRSYDVTEFIATQRGGDKNRRTPLGRASQHSSASTSASRDGSDTTPWRADTPGSLALVTLGHARSASKAERERDLHTQRDRYVARVAIRSLSN